LQPNKTKGFKLSSDPFFVDKVKDVVGLYPSPPENAIALAVDEKSQCQVNGVKHTYSCLWDMISSFARY
jgi:hypothetical protein